MMNKTTALKKLVTQQLAPVGRVYFEEASAGAAYPYLVFDFDHSNAVDTARDDIDMTVDVWDRGKDTKRVEALADAAEKVFNAANLPQEDILPTFYRDVRNTVKDPDKTIKHIQLHFIVQLYEKE